MTDRVFARYLSGTPLGMRLISTGFGPRNYISTIKAEDCTTHGDVGEVLMIHVAKRGALGCHASHSQLSPIDPQALSLDLSTTKMRV
jgi:hypothetical protein